MQTGPLPKEVALYSDFVSGVTPCVTKTECFSKECCKRYRIFRETIERDARPVGAVALRRGRGAPRPARVISGSEPDPGAAGPGSQGHKHGGPGSIDYVTSSVHKRKELER